MILQLISAEINIYKYIFSINKISLFYVVDNNGIPSSPTWNTYFEVYKLKFTNPEKTVDFSIQFQIIYNNSVFLYEMPVWNAKFDRNIQYTSSSRLKSQEDKKPTNSTPIFGHPRINSSNLEYFLDKVLV